VTDALHLHDVAVPFGDSPGLAAVSLRMAAGERLALLGPSGEGKTTLLRAIAGLAPVRAGRITIGARDVTALPPERRDAVYLHQVPVLFPHLRVRENVAFPLAVRGMSRAERERAVAPLLERLGLSTFADRLPSALSGGQRHRVALARALAAKPQVLLLDEPLAALDPVLRADVREAIREAHAESGAAVVLVTHDLDDATTLGDRIAVLLGRELAQVATPVELFARPASLSVLRFLGAHQELRGVVVTNDAVDTAIGRVIVEPDQLRASHCSTGAPVIVGVRGDAIRCRRADHADAPGLGRVLAITPRPRGSTATLTIGDQRVEALIDALQPPAIGDAVRVDVDPRGLVLFPA
jgi:ABC-type sugar transport system ATPase subunit